MAIPRLIAMVNLQSGLSASSLPNNLAILNCQRDKPNDSCYKQCKNKSDQVPRYTAGMLNLVLSGTGHHDNGHKAHNPG